jgi:hypothetical protein
MENANDVNLTMRKETLLVIFEFLARSYEDWRTGGGAHGDELSDETFKLSKPDAGERVALWRLEGAIERTFPEIFSNDYRELIEKEKRRLRAELYGS